jgi:hypothetical protein
MRLAWSNGRGKDWCSPPGELAYRNEFPRNEGMSKHSFEAWQGAKLFEVGLGQVVITRHKSQSETEVGVFLVDAYCLGVKNASYTRVAGKAVPELLERIYHEEGRSVVTPACARRLIESAVAYARNLGLEPHPDFKSAARVFGGIDSSECDAAFTFGFEGKPLYFQGPHDSPVVVERIMRLLKAHCGEGNYNFIVGGPVPEAED